jgi:transaldolase
MATALFNSRQALMSALAGANYVAPYLGRLEKNGGDPWVFLQNVLHLFQTYRLKTKILGASLYEVEHVMHCAEAGIYGVTVKDDLFDKLIENDPLTLKCVEQFSEAWKSVKAPLFAF